MIASALRDVLVTVSKHELMTGTGLRLLSDSCHGQNKNTNVLSMLTAFRKQQCPHLTITNVFPVDTAFCLLTVFSDGLNRTFGNNLQSSSQRNAVHRHLQDWQSYGFRSAATRSIKATKPCKISTVKVLEIRGSCVGMKDTYSADVTTYSILEKGQNWHPPFCQLSHM